MVQGACEIKTFPKASVCFCEVANPLEQIEDRAIVVVLFPLNSSHLRGSNKSLACKHVMQMCCQVLLLL